MAFGWGVGVVGHGDNTTITRPVRTPVLDHVASVGCGDFTCYAVTSQGTARAWGYNFSGNLGLGTSDERWHSVARTIPGLRNVIQVAGTASSGFALTRRGAVWSWGANDYGQLGRGLKPRVIGKPAPIKGLAHVVQIATSRGGGNGVDVVYAVTSVGTVYGWGADTTGQLADRSTTNKSRPIRVGRLHQVVEVASTHWYGTYALTSNGTVWAWGQNRATRTPRQVTGLTGIGQISGSNASAWALKKNGTVWSPGTAWAFGRHGTQPRRQPHVSDIRSIATSGYSYADSGSGTTVYARRSDGTVLVWGDGAGFGNRTNKRESRPVRVSRLSHVTAVFGGMTSNAYVISR